VQINTFGKDIEEAGNMAADALRGIVRIWEEAGCTPPVPTPLCDLSVPEGGTAGFYACMSYR